MDVDAASLAEDVGVSDSQVINVGAGALDVSDGRNESNERQLAEKLEKSEAGRKKLRQAIALLKEKLEVTSQALEVNEALRQEVEWERLNADAERKRAEAEKLLREKVEKENLTIKEQLIGVLQRLDSLEGSQKADRSEFSRIHSEVKEAVGGIGAALQAVEATKGLYQTLERSLHAKINGAVQSSSKALAVAQSGQATTSRAQAAALAAQSLAKAVQKEVQIVSSQVATLQKHGSNLNALEASLQQESQLRGPGTPLNSPDSGETNTSLAAPKEKVSSDDVSPSSSALPAQGMVLSKSQTEAQKGSQAKDDHGEGEMLNMLVASTEKSRNNLVTDKSRNNLVPSSTGLPPRGGMFLSRSQLPDGGLKPQASIPQVRPGAKSPRKGPSDESTPNAPLSQPGSAPLKKGPVAIITGVDSILSPAVSLPAPLDPVTKSGPSLYITAPTARASGLQKQSESHAPKGLASRKFSNKRPVVMRSRGDLNVAGSDEAMNLIESCSLKGIQRSKSGPGMAGRQATSIPGPNSRNESFNTVVVEADETFSEGMPLSNGKPYPNTTTKLLKSVIKMFEKEGKNRRNMEEKLMKLQEALESHCGPRQVAQISMKRKRESRKEKADGTSEEKGKKRLRQGKKVTKFSLEDAVTSQSEEKGAQQNDEQASGDCPPAQGRLSEMISTEPGGGEGLFETTADCKENRDVPEAQECNDASDVDICNEEVSKEGTGTNTDLESTDDDLGEDWWAKKVLLSPISSNDLAS